MSRFILLPAESKNRFVLVSSENPHRTKTIDLPDELYDMEIFNKVKNRTKVNNLLYRISRSRISRTMDGFIKDKNNVCNVNYADGVISCCNNRFNECFEEFYCILKNYGIIF